MVIENKAEDWLRVMPVHLPLHGGFPIWLRRDDAIDFIRKEEQ